MMTNRPALLREFIFVFLRSCVIHHDCNAEFTKLSGLLIL